ncbi:ABC transporter permease [Chthonobacter albigriseus]|uniref:ABC transporter permease n=1 Tax=Chthonobacter albigriseus TaxID=1683161 RepID=UPI0015EFDA13|nr:ABC transporter permease [Chthonobacter albigriseus]
MSSLAEPAHRSLRAQTFRAALPDRLIALGLVLPALLFLVVTFIAPIGALLMKSVDNAEPAAVLVETLPAIGAWDGVGLPPEPVFAALAADLKAAQKNRTAAGLGKRLNYELPGMRSKILSAARAVSKIETPPAGGWTEAITGIDPVWKDTQTWSVLQRNASPVTAHYLLNSLDLTRGPDGAIAAVPESEAIFLTILGRTLFIAAVVTLGTLVLGYPLAYAAAIAPPAVAATLMLFVLLPLWTSLLVRTTAWVVLLQSNGVINDFMMRLGFTSEPVQLIFTRFGTLAAMIHIQLPFTVLPIYSVMRQIPQTQLRAARSLGAGPLSAFWRIYAPQTIPGVSAGCLITFILSLGYYLTPALVGGATDQMMSNFISDFINRDLNWGLASALGTVLLLTTLALYAVYVRVLGADRIRLG